jgi:hypothetical protein
MRYVAAAALMAAPGGCVDDQGRITSASLDRYLRVVGALPSERPELPAPAGPVEAPSRPNAAWGTLSASRSGRTVTIEVLLADVPGSVKVFSTGLKLADGSAIRPETVSLGESPMPRAEAAPADKAAPRVDFSFGPRRPPAGGAVLRSLQLTYGLPKTAGSVDDSIFTLVLGEAEGTLACRMGITLGVSTLDGGPGLAECVVLELEEDYLDLPLPPAQPLTTPVMCFRLKEAPGRLGHPGVAAPIVAEITPLPSEPVAKASLNVGPDGL